MIADIEYEDDGIRLDRWFKRHLPHIPHSLLQKELRKGTVKLENKKAETSTRVEEGQVLRFPDEWADEEPKATAAKPKQKTEISASLIKDLEKCIIFEDKHMLVLNKPAGLASQGGTGQKENVDDILRARAEERGEASPKLVHRLDRDTSGILVLGKSSNDAAELAKAFARKQSEKIYWALVVGVPSIAAGKIDLPLAKRTSGKDSRMEKMEEDEENGKNAITHYQLKDQAGKRLAWVELYPVTGRTHQLRVHMQAIGHPILGDGKYGGREAFIDGEDIEPQLHLHARKLTLPFHGKTLTFVAPLTGHMKKSWKMFEFSEK